MRFDPNDPPELVYFEGVTYRRMGGVRRYYLSQSTTNAGRRGAKGLHVAIWESANKQEVPPGYEVHHIDHDTFNFDVGNLECLPKGVHRRQPKYIDPDLNAASLAKAREAAKVWHRSDEGRAWHRAHAAKSIKRPGAPKPYSKVAPVEKLCEWCGGPFSTVRPRETRFCGMPCAGACSRYLRGKRKRAHPYYANTQNIPNDVPRARLQPRGRGS